MQTSVYIDSVLQDSIEALGSVRTFRTLHNRKPHIINDSFTDAVKQQVKQPAPLFVYPYQI